MNFDEANRLFEIELESWSATSTLVFDNVENLTTPPKDESWARFVITWLPSENRALGDKVTKNGIATLQVFTPRNVGPRVGAKIADAYIELLENRVIGSTIFTYAGAITRLGDGQEWYQINADLPFQAT